MTTKISPKEWEALSAYLDGQLSSQERTRLESRLEASTELRATLDDLRQTRTLLRSQPRLRAPRNFTLTPEMAGLYGRRRPLPGAYPALRLATILASLFFVVVLAGNLVTQSMAPIPIFPGSAQQEQAAPAAPAFGMGGGGGGGGMVEPPAAMAIAPTEALAGTQEAQTMVEVPPGEAEGARVAVTPYVAKALETPTPMDLTERSSNQAVTAPDQITGQNQPPSEEALGTAETDQAEGTITVQTILLVLQGLLALLAIGAGVGVVILRRSTRI
jgi:anti-sigma factor RsiW